jgi:hypothetical protein
MTEGRRAGARTGGREAAAYEVDRLAEIEERLARIERAPGLRERGRGLMHRVVPVEAARHFRNAGREQLLGVRAIVDFWIDKIDDSEGRVARDRHESIEITE